MKPSKKKNCQGKNDLNENTSTPKIDSYFKIAAKEFNLKFDDKLVSTENELKAKYIGALKKKLQDLTVPKKSLGETAKDNIDHEVEDVGTSSVVVTGELCACEPALELGLNLHAPSACTECKQWEIKYNKMKMNYLKLTICNAEMDLKFEDLLKTKTSANQFVSDGAGSSSDDIFSPREIIYLQCMPLEKKSDSTFVLNCLQYAYKDDLSVLHGRTLKGKSEVLQLSEEGGVEHVVPSKDRLTPKKVERIRDMFIQRISKCQLDAVEYGSRVKDTYLNKLIASSIRNIVKKKTVIVSEQN